MMSGTTDVPDEPVHLVQDGEGEILQLGPTKMRILEDGSRTGTRLGVVEIILQGNTNGPTPHWHEMHDETFLVTQGRARFVVRDGDKLKNLDLKTGDFVTAQIRAVHTFANPFPEEAKLFCTVTPHFYINYFRTLAALAKEKALNPTTGKEAMARYATITLPGENEWKGLQRVAPES